VETPSESTTLDSSAKNQQRWTAARKINNAGQQREKSTTLDSSAKNQQRCAVSW